PYRLPAGRAVRFSFQNLDDRLELELDGEPLLALELQPAEDQTSSVSLALEGEGADLAELMVARDIYYTTPLSEPFVVTAGHYFMLGDNTQDSSDSREWRYVIFEQDDGAGGTTIVRGNWRDRENPRIVGYGDAAGPQTYLVDEWGEKHWFERDEARRRAPLFAPLVPRELVHGRAMAVFWPLDPVRGIWRLKWVH
ncbi:MAG: S26 family signal peptidase, partial [Planctomycetota bacterium]